MAVETIDTVGERIRYAREAAGLTQSEIASHFQIARVSVSQWESNTTRPAIERIASLAAMLNTTTEWLLEKKGVPPLVPPRKERTKGQIVDEVIPGSDLVSQAKELPIFAAAMGGDGHMIISFEAIDYMKRPAVLQNVTGGYGILVKGESMVPAYWPGDVALVHPHLSPARDTDNIFYHTPPTGAEAEAIIKRLVGFNDREWTLEQYKPAKTFKEAVADWPICHRVVGRYNAR